MNSFIASLIYFLQAAAQPAVGMADEMRTNGRIYVVIAVMLTILLGISLYLFRLDRKISRMEKRA
jgi:hypothetical protein